MKSVSRFVMLCCTLAIALFAIAGCQQGPKPTYPGGKPTIEHAKSLESDNKPDEAYVELVDVKNGAGNDRELPARALLLSAELEIDPVRCCRYSGLKAGDPSLSTDARQQITEKQTQAEIKGHEALKELLKDYSGTKAAEQTAAQNVQPRLEARIDERNRTQWSYKLIDALVGFTGRKQGFSYWFALLLIAFIVKGVTLPLQVRMYKSQRETQRLQPAIKLIQEKNKDNPQESQRLVMEFYKEHGVNPFASCFPMLIQLPFMIWVYNTIRLYEFHFAHGTFLWVNPKMALLNPQWIAADLSQFDLAMLIIYTASMYLTMKLTPATDPAAAQQQQSMSLMTTGMMFFFFIKYRWSAAFVFYWLILNVLSAAQSYYFVYKPNKDNPVVPVVLPEDRAGKSNGSGSGSGKATVKPATLLSPATSPGPAPTRPRRPRKPRSK